MNPVLDKYTASMPISAKAIMYGFCIMYACVSLYTPAQGFGIEHETLKVLGGGDLPIREGWQSRRRPSCRRPFEPPTTDRPEEWAAAIGVAARALGV